MKILILAFLSLGGVSAYTSYCLACDEDQATMVHNANTDEDQATMVHNANTLYLETWTGCDNTPADHQVIPGMI